MANMKSIASDCAPKAKFPSTPFLGRSDRGLIVMFTGNDGCWGTGVVLHTGTGSSAFCVGHHSTKWSMAHFTVFTGSVTVSTDY